MEKPKSENDGSPCLSRELNLLDTAFLVIGAVVGSGIFLTPGLVAKELPYPGLLIVVWIAGGIITLCGALSFAELGAMYPEAGGQYVYLREAYGSAAGFLFGWGFFGFLMCGGIAALAVAFAEYLGVFIPILSTSNVLAEISLFGATRAVSAGQAVAVGSILLLSFLHTHGLKTGITVQNALTFFRIAAVLIIVILGVLIGKKSGVSNFEILFPEGMGFSRLLKPFGLALIAVFWTYDGWYSANCAAAEIKKPERNIPLGLILGTLGVLVLYVLVNVVYLLALPMQEMIGVVQIGETASRALFGGGIGSLISTIIMISIFGCLNATILYGPRVYYAMASDGIFFRSMGSLHPRRRVPSRALKGQAFWASALCLTGTYQSLFEFTVFALLVFYAATGIAVVVLRHKRPELPRPYKAWGYPILTCIFVAASLAIFANILWTEPLKSAVGIVLLGSGLPAYFYWRRQKK